MDTPLVTILIPSYNHATYVVTALQSVLKQSYTTWELLLLDDASTDATEHVVNDFLIKNAAALHGRMVYLRQVKNAGSPSARNIGLQKARGKYITILDSDDIWTDPKKLEKQVAFLEQNRTYGVLGTWAKKIDANGNEIGTITYETADEKIRSHMLRRHQFAHSSVMFLRGAALDVGGYNTSYVVADDFDFILAIGKKYKLANLADYTSCYRIHSGTLTSTRRKLQIREHLAIVKKYRHDYPDFLPALIKSYLRIFLAYF
ncbi:MAG: glycosyltransferase family A protein [bacterium]